nr:hypothetical protein [Pedobacter panaciterrae]
MENIIAIPHTIERIGKLLTALPKGQAISIINCEDEPYIAVGTGCAIGMTHGVMWHRIALPFGINKTDNYIDSTLLHDNWLMKNRESWMSNHGEGYNNKMAPLLLLPLDEPSIVSLLINLIPLTDLTE